MILYMAFHILYFNVKFYFSEGGEEGEEDDPDEYVHVDEKYYYLEYIIRGLGITHAIVSFCMCIAYYNLKVPLAIFKREKEVARRLEFDGLYLAEQPEDDDMKGHWDKLVISAKYAIIFKLILELSKIYNNQFQFQFFVRFD